MSSDHFTARLFQQAAALIRRSAKQVKQKKQYKKSDNGKTCHVPGGILRPGFQ